MYYCCSLGIESVSLELVVADTSGDTDVWVNEELVAQNLAVTTMDLGHHKPADMVTLRDAEPPSGAPEKTGKEGRTGMCIGKSWTLWFDNYTCCWGGILVSLRPSVRPSVCPASCVRSVAPTVLVGSISYLYILSSNFRRCVACKFSFGNFLEVVILTLSCFDLVSHVNH